MINFVIEADLQCFYQAIQIKGILIIESSL
jgi:hypothetical protein